MSIATGAEAVARQGPLAWLESIRWPVQRLRSSRSNAARQAGGPDLALDAERFLGRAMA